LAPERLLTPDSEALQILRRCDGRTAIGVIVDELAAGYKAERSIVLVDVLSMLQGLFDKKFLINGRDSDGPTQVPWAPDQAEPVAVSGGDERLPVSLLAELTHRCPLQCPYCSNPLDLMRASDELSTDEWMKVIDQAAAMGVLQIHFSGGEPLVRKDLADLVRCASANGLYTNLITSGVLLDSEKLAALAQAGLDHIQISFQGVEENSADRVAGHRGAHAKKLLAAELVRAFAIPLTVNAVVHRQNLHQLPQLIDMAVELGAARLEVAHVQYLGWALKNRAALIPTADQFEEATRIVEAARDRLKGVLVIDYVIPDYYAIRPKKCMGGWGEQFLNVTPSGRVLPCHAAESIAGLLFDSVREHSLSWIWRDSSAFQKFRGTDWMSEPCKSCAFRESDRGGCRCQAFALTGNAASTDPTCALSPRHAEIVAIADIESKADHRHFSYRTFG
jgi:pyrroloquinoline quinone biosynthesis protein E